MKRTFHAAAMIGLGLVVVFGTYHLTKSVRAEKRPIIEVRETLDLGSHELGKWLAVPLRVSNHGEAALVLTNCRTSCGCVVLSEGERGSDSDVKEATIEPGEHREFLIRTTIRGEIGQRFVNTIHFDTNDPDRLHICVELSADIEGQVIAIPSSHHFDGVSRGGKVHQTFEIRDLRREKSSVYAVSCDQKEWLSVDWKACDRPTDPGNPALGRIIATVNVSANVPSTGGTWSGNIQVFISDNLPTITVPIQLTVPKVVQIYPSIVVLPQRRDGTLHYSGAFRCVSRAIDDESKIEIVSASEGLTTSERGIREPDGRSGKEITISWDPKGETKGAATPKRFIRIKGATKDTSDVIEIPVFCRQPE